MDFEGISRLPGNTTIFDVMSFPFSANPFTFKARRQFRFCIPEEWYRRSKSRNVSPAVGPSELTIRRLAALQESDEEEEEEGTAKVAERKFSPTRQDSTKTVEQRGLVTQGRLSSLFEGWLHSSPPTTPTRNSAIFSPENRKTVSEPKLVEKKDPTKHIRSGSGSSDASDDEDEEMFKKAFEDMVVSWI